MLGLSTEVSKIYLMLDNLNLLQLKDNLLLISNSNVLQSVFIDIQFNSFEKD
jgi:hypothetical protein